MKTMFIGVIVAIIMLTVLLIVVASQQMQINEINRQDILEAEFDRCSLIILNSNPYSLDSQNRAEIEWIDCVSNVMNEYGTKEQIEEWELMQDEKQQKQENRDIFIEKMIQDCREKYLGQMHEMNKCIDLMNEYDSQTPLP